MRRHNAQLDELYTHDPLNRLIGMQRGTLNIANDALTAASFEYDWTLDEMGNWEQFDEDADGDGSADLVQARDHDKVNQTSDIAAATGPQWSVEQRTQPLKEDL